ncbi:hypothetical protein ACFL0Z_01190 [Patescibacteria group bacterium]
MKVKPEKAMTILACGLPVTIPLAIWPLQTLRCLGIIWCVAAVCLFLYFAAKYPEPYERIKEEG